MNSREIFIATCKNTLKRYLEAGTPAKRAAVLSGETVQGIKQAISFVKALDHELLTDEELKHAIRLTRFRGQACCKFKGSAAH